jgi:hypothetical protein
MKHVSKNFSQDNIFINFYAVLLIFLSFNLFSNPYYKYGENISTLNIFGESGIIVLPSAKIKPSGSLNFSFSRGDFYKYGSLTISPFDWIEANYFYYRPDDLYWGIVKGAALDKGFSVKFSKNINRLSLAIGLSDFAGTGYFTREYFVGSYDFNGFRLTGGLGFGKFAFRDGFKNPFSFLAEEFKTRNSETYGFGGKPSYDQWFRGNAAFIGGAEFFLWGPLKNTAFKVEYDPFDYFKDFSVKGSNGQELDLRKRESNINFGFTHSFTNNISLGLYLIKGNTLNFTFTFGGNFSKSFFAKKKFDNEIYKTQKGATPEQNFYENLILNTNKKQIFLQSAEIENKNLKVAVSSSKFRDPIYIHKKIGKIAFDLKEEMAIDLTHVTTIPVNVGFELSRITTPAHQFNDSKQYTLENVINDSVLSPGEINNFKQLSFRPTVKYPAIFSGFAPSIVNHIGDPRRFYFGGITLRMDNEIQLSRSLMIKTEIHQNIANNFDEKENNPDSKLPHVRTDIVSYLQESDTYITRMQGDYFFSPRKEIFAKVSMGLLEDMYAGYGAEFLYKPFESNFSLSLDLYKVKKRDFERKFELLKYRAKTGHISFNYHIPNLDILGTLSFGKYLAGDEGYTFDISRRLDSGFRAGIFFTRTNVSVDLFGEGSFDKGFYFQIPIDLFLNDYRGGYINFKLRPLTRDGGQKLQAGNDLIGIMHSTSRAEIERYWGAFND